MDGGRCCRVWYEGLVGSGKGTVFDFDKRSPGSVADVADVLL